MKDTACPPGRRRAWPRTPWRLGPGPRPSSCTSWPRPARAWGAWGAEVELSAELPRDLEALGYVDSEAPAGAASGGD